MALPKIDVPVYDCILPSNKKKVKFRPFLVKEQKLLLMATESTEIKDSVEAMKQVVKNCILDDISVDSLPVFDLEFLFLNLRARSVSEVVKVKYKCNNIIKPSDIDEEEKRCDNIVDVEINVLEVTPEFGQNHSNKIELSNDLGIVFNYPTFEMIESMSGKSENDVLFDLIINCIDYIYDADQLYYSKDSSKEEMIEFIDGLQQEHMKKIEEFFDTLPKIKKDIHFECNKCGHHEDIVIEGIQSFFV